MTQQAENKWLAAAQAKEAAERSLPGSPTQAMWNRRAVQLGREAFHETQRLEGEQLLSGDV